MIDVFEEDDVNTGSGDKFLKVFEEVNSLFTCGEECGSSHVPVGPGSQVLGCLG